MRATALVSGRDRTPDEPGAVERAVAKAYDMAGVGPDDLDVVEVHDAAAPAELMIYEELGLCGPGEGPKLLASGETALGGRIPVNPSGGLLAKGPPHRRHRLRPAGGAGRPAAGPVRRPPGARAPVALAENGGGFLGTDPAAMVITVLSRS